MKRPYMLCLHCKKTAIKEIDSETKLISNTKDMYYRVIKGKETDIESHYCKECMKTSNKWGNTRQARNEAMYGRPPIIHYFDSDNLTSKEKLILEQEAITRR